MDVLEAIRTARAVREFTEQPLSDEAIRAILNAGRRAQSSKNAQPWHFIAVRDRDTLRQLAQCGRWAGHLAGAALGVALVSEEPAGFDLGQAAALMQLAAWDQGVGSCLAAMWEPERARAILGFPDALHCRYALSFGYPAPQQQRPAAVQGPGRRPLREVVHYDRW